MDIGYYRRVLAKRLPDYGQLFKDYCFFDLFPLDGGGYFVHHERVGAGDDLEVAARVVSGEPFADWGMLGKLDFQALARYDTLQHHQWLQRLYVLGPLARAWTLSRDSRFLDTFRLHWRDWHRQHPLPVDLAGYLAAEKEKFRQQSRQTGPISRVWFDFNPACRSLLLPWCLYLLGDDLDDETWSLILQSLADHAQVLLANYDNWPDMPGNHHVLMAVGLAYLGCLFREEPFAERCLKIAREVAATHVADEVGADDMSLEGSPSYLLFSLMQYREIWAVLERNGQASPIPRSRLEQMVQGLLAITQPNGQLADVNDGYPVDARPSLAIGAKLFGRGDLRVFDGGSTPDFTSLPLPDSGYLVARRGWTAESPWVLLDATRPIGIDKASHAQAGKLNVTWWARGRALLLGGSGTGPYDSPLFGEWFRRGPAHSTVLVDGREDADFIGPWEWERLPVIQLESFQEDLEVTVIEATSDGFERLPEPVRWTRRVELAETGDLMIRDHLETAGTHDYQWIWRLDEGAEPLFSMETTPELAWRRETHPTWRPAGIRQDLSLIGSLTATGPITVCHRFRLAP